MNREKRLKKKKKKKRKKTKQLRPQRWDFRKFHQFCCNYCDHLNFLLLVVNRLPKPSSYLKVKGVEKKKFTGCGEVSVSVFLMQQFLVHKYWDRIALIYHSRNLENYHIYESPKQVSNSISTVRLQNRADTQLVKQIYRPGICISVFTRDDTRFLSIARWLLVTVTYDTYSLKINLNIIRPSTYRSSNWYISYESLLNTIWRNYGNKWLRNYATSVNLITKGYLSQLYSDVRFRMNGVRFRMFFLSLTIWNGETLTKLSTVLQIIQNQLSWSEKRSYSSTL